MNFTRTLSILCAAVSMSACAGPLPEVPVGDAAPPEDAAPVVDAAPVAPPREHCDAPVPASVSNFVAYRDGVIFGVSDGATSRIERWSGAGCDITQASVSGFQGVLMDVDDAGNAYVQHDGDARVSRVDADDTVTELAYAGRGIWSFGVSPSGNTMWMTSCGPTGIFAMGDTTMPVMGEPPTLWQMEPAVLTADDVFWSVGARDCAPSEPTTPACGYELVRATAREYHDTASTLVDFGAGYEHGQLSRCGAGVCGRFESGVVVWNDLGGIVTTLRPADFGMTDGERIAQVSGNVRGVYALLEGGPVRRLVFVPIHAR